MRLIAPSLLLLTLAAAAPARADELVGPVGAAPYKGTHWLVQATAGVTADGTATYGALLGVGGRAFGSPLRLYLLFEAAGGSGAASGSGTTGSYSAAYRGADIEVGLRALVPLAGNLRLYLDLLGGGTVGTWSLDRTGLTARSSEGGAGLFDVAGGLDWRLVRNLSLGVRVKTHLVDTTPGWLSAMGATIARRADVTAALTLHF